VKTFGDNGSNISLFLRGLGEGSIFAIQGLKYPFGRCEGSLESGYFGSTSSQQNYEFSISKGKNLVG
jgi:hypothetical protein